MIASTITLNERQACPYCFETLNPNSGRQFVQCESCNAIYHKDCWEKIEYCVNRLDNNALCKAKQAKPVTLISSTNLAISATGRTPIRFEGIALSRTQASLATVKSSRQLLSPRNIWYPFKNLQTRHDLLSWRSIALHFIMAFASLNFLMFYFNLTAFSNEIIILFYLVIGGSVLTAFVLILQTWNTQNILARMIKFGYTALNFWFLFISFPFYIFALRGSRFPINPPLFIELFFEFLPDITSLDIILISIAVLVAASQKTIRRKMIIGTILITVAQLIHSFLFSYFLLWDSEWEVQRLLTFTIIFGIAIWIPSIIYNRFFSKSATTTIQG